MRASARGCRRRPASGPPLTIRPRVTPAGEHRDVEAGPGVIVPFRRPCRHRERRTVHRPASRGCLSRHQRAVERDAHERVRRVAELDLRPPRRHRGRRERGPVRDLRSAVGRRARGHEPHEGAERRDHRRGAAIRTPRRRRTRRVVPDGIATGTGGAARSDSRSRISSNGVRSFMGRPPGSGANAGKPSLATRAHSPRAVSTRGSRRCAPRTDLRGSEGRRGPLAVRQVTDRRPQLVIAPASGPGTGSGRRSLHRTARSSGARRCRTDRRSRRTAVGRPRTARRHRERQSCRDPTKQSCTMSCASLRSGRAARRTR